MRAKHARQIREGIRQANYWIDVPFSEQIYGPERTLHDLWLKYATELEWHAFCVASDRIIERRWKTGFRG